MRNLVAYQHEVEITDELRRNLKGRWPTVLLRILPELAPAIKAGPKKHVKCPYHQAGQGRTTPNAQGGQFQKSPNDFRIRDDFANTGGCFCSCSKALGNGFAVIMHAKRCSFIEAKRLVIEELGGGLIASHVPASYIKEVDPREQAREDARTRHKIQQYWDQSVPLDHPDAAPARRWLSVRGLDGIQLPIRNLRCHPALDYYVDTDGRIESIGRFPALIGMVRDVNGKTSTIHRTYLEPDGSGKARRVLELDLDVRKQYSSPSTHPVRGCAIKFDVDPYPALNVGEGIETMLSVRMLAPIPTWSVLNKELLRQVVVPDYVRFVTVWTDRDRSLAGQEAAIELVARLRAEGRRAIAMLPPFALGGDQKSIDWNNVIQSQGVEVMRRNIHFLNWKRRLMQLLDEQSRSTLSSRSAS